MSLKLPLLFTPPLLQYLRQHPQLPKNTWYFIAAAALTALNRPEEIPIIFKHALENVPNTGDEKSKANEELRVLRKIRESLLKTSAVAGAPRVINACLALKECTPKYLQDLDGDKSITGRGADVTEMPSSQVLQKGQAFFDKIYGKISGRVTRMMQSSGTEDLDLIAKLMYGYILSNTTLLNQMETSFVLVAALIPQDVPNQLKGHLKGASNGGASAEEIRAVREIVIGICESAGMERLQGTIGYGWQHDIPSI